MRARVDSGEFSRAVKVARRYTAGSATDITRMIWLEVEGNILALRTTTYMSNCIARVNAFDTEDGGIMTICERLDAVSIDTGEMLDISTDGNRIVLDYGDNQIRLETTDDTVEDFPVWIETEQVAVVDKNILNIAVANTRPMEEVGMPIKASVHFVPKDSNGIYVFAHSGFQGVLSILEGTIGNPVSIEGESLARALSVMDGIVAIGIRDSHITIRGETSPYEISFTTIASPDPTSIVGMFNQPVIEDKMRIVGENLLDIAAWCKRAVSIDPASQMLIDTDNGALVYLIKGHGVNMDGRVAIDGSVPKSIFHCQLFTIISEIRKAEELTITAAMGEEDKAWFWYVDGLDRHQLLCFKSNLFD